MIKLKRATSLFVVESITSVSDYVEKISKYFKTLNNKEEYSKDYAFFRGQPDEEYGLIPCLGRNIPNTSNNLLMFERKMIQTALLQRPDEFQKTMYPVNMLAKMQHYGLPTRLLDVSRNALVALYFACCEQFAKNGSVFCFRASAKKVYNSYDTVVNVIGSLYLASAGRNSRIKPVISRFSDIIKYESFYPQKFRDLELDRLNRKIHFSLRGPQFVLPELLSEREKRQHAAFIIFPNSINNSDADNVGDLVIQDELPDMTGAEYKDSIKCKFIISKHRKKTILKELSLLGITKEFLFPELENICCSIKEDASVLLQELNEEDDVFDILSLSEEG